LVIPIANANKTELDLPLFPPEVPDLVDTGYTLYKGWIIVCKIKTPEPDVWMTNSKYGGGSGVYSDGQDIRIYTVLNKEWFSTTPVLRVFSNGKKQTDIKLDDDAFGKNIEIYIAYGCDGTIIIGYRYGKDTTWKNAYREVAGASMLTVKSINAFDFELKGGSCNGNGDPFPTPTTKTDIERKNQQNMNLALAGLGGIAIAVLVTMINRRRVK
jgi:hypothetical protein